ARLLRGAKSHDGESKSRGGFYSWLDRNYMHLLRWAMARRMPVIVVSILIVLSSVPLYKLVRQEFIPTNVDEGEFEVNLTAPEGASLTAMNEVAMRAEKEMQGVPCIRAVLGSAGGGGFLGNVNTARFFIILTPHEERTFGWKRLLSLKPWQAFQNNYSQSEI